jgi:hypothetical protein
MDRNELLDMCGRMEVYGGGFAHALARALILADLINQQKILNAFPEMIERYGPDSIFTVGKDMD